MPEKTLRNAGFAGWLCLCVLLTTCAGCRARSAQGAVRTEDVSPTTPAHDRPPADALGAARHDEPVQGGPPVFELDRAWGEITDLAFERAIDAWLPPGEEHRLRPMDLAALGRALGGDDAIAVRAAVLLARSRDPAAGEVLLAQLEERTESAGGRDAAKIVAAAAFSGGMTANEAGRRLAGLSAGSRPHPEATVRVECGVSSLALGRDEAIPYLLDVLRAGTTAEIRQGPWREEDLAPAQARAAEALSARARTACFFRPEGSVREREEEAARLERLLPPPRKLR